MSNLLRVQLKQKPQITICTSKDLFGLVFGAEAAPKVDIDITVKSKTKKYNKNRSSQNRNMQRKENESERHFEKLLVPKEQEMEIEWEFGSKLEGKNGLEGYMSTYILSGTGPRGIG